MADSLGSAGSYTQIALTFAGASGYFYFARVGALSMTFVEAAGTLPLSTSIPEGTVLASGIPAPWIPLSGNRLVIFGVYNGSSMDLFPCAVSSGGNLSYIGPSYTAAAANALQGSTVYRIG